jgi:hypothetical protein
MSKNVSGMLKDWLVNDTVCKTRHKNYAVLKYKSC